MIKNSVWLNLYMYKTSQDRKKIIFPEYHRWFCIVFPPLCFEILGKKKWQLLHLSVFFVKCAWMCHRTRQRGGWQAKGFWSSIHIQHLILLRVGGNTQQNTTAHFLWGASYSTYTHLQHEIWGPLCKGTLKAIVINSTMEDWCNFKNEHFYTSAGHQLSSEVELQHYIFMSVLSEDKIFPSLN